MKKKKRISFFYLKAIPSQAMPTNNRPNDQANKYKMPYCMKRYCQQDVHGEMREKQREKN